MRLLWLKSGARARRPASHRSDWDCHAYGDGGRAPLRPVPSGKGSGVVPPGQDLQDLVVLTDAQYRQRAAQVLTSYSQPAEDGGPSFLEKLIAGMPKRLEKCKANGYGRCGK